MTDDFDRAKDLFRWNERLFGVLGAWPLTSTYVRFVVCIVYYIAHITMENIDLYYVFGDLQLMVKNLSESAFGSLILIKLLCLRFSRKIVTLVQRTIDSIDVKFFESSKEREIYLNYNRIAKSFFKLWVLMGIVTAVGYYLTPLLILIQTGGNDESATFVLPYRVHLFFEVNDSSTFYLTWMYQAPVIYFGIWHTVAIGFVISLVLHVCGLLAVLAFRIRNLDMGDGQDLESFRLFFHDVTRRYRDILRLENEINDVFGLILLEELLLTTVLIGLSCYVALTTIEKDVAQSFSCLLYGITLLILIYGYCAAGEFLITESANLYNAYYECCWYEMPATFRRQLLICMIAARKPLQLSGGDIYVFCLFNYTGIVKTAVGYVSMLRSTM